MAASNCINCQIFRLVTRLQKGIHKVITGQTLPVLLSVSSGAIVRHFGLSGPIVKGYQSGACKSPHVRAICHYGYPEGYRGEPCLFGEGALMPPVIESIALAVGGAVGGNLFRHLLFPLEPIKEETPEQEIPNDD